MILRKILSYKALPNQSSHDTTYDQDQETPTKVAIVCAPRTGSSYLQSLLKQHDHVVGYGEVFGRSGGKVQIMRQYNKTPFVSHTSGADFLHNLLHDYPSHIHAITFKITYEQARKNKWITAAWDYLKHKKVKIIHLYRENLLDQYLSLQLAQRTKYWGSERPQYDQEKYNAPITINPRECLAFMHRNKKYRCDADHDYAQNPKINLSYETLTAQPVPYVQKIQEFIGLPYQDNLTCPLQKQRIKSKSEIIKNYDVLVKKLSGTEWEQFLDA